MVRRPISPHGQVTDGGGLLCGLGALQCTRTVAEGTQVRLAGLPAWSARSTAGTAATRRSGRVPVHDDRAADGDRVLGLRLRMGQWEPPPDGLFDPDRKAEIADNGANAAADGAVGCALTAAVIGTAGQGSILVAGSAGVATRLAGAGTDGVRGDARQLHHRRRGTIGNGVLLKIDLPTRSGAGWRWPAVSPGRERRGARWPAAARSWTGHASGSRSPTRACWSCRRRWRWPPTATATPSAGRSRDAGAARGDDAGHERAAGRRPPVPPCGRGGAGGRDPRHRRALDRDPEGGRRPLAGPAVVGSRGCRRRWSRACCAST